MFITTDICKIIDANGKGKKCKDATQMVCYIMNTERCHLFLSLLSSYWFCSATSWCAQLYTAHWNSGTTSILAMHGIIGGNNM